LKNNGSTTIYFDKSKAIKDSTDANGLISTKHYYGPVTKILLK